MGWSTVGKAGLDIIIPALSTVCIVISAALVAFGWFWIRKGNKAAHRRCMIAAAFFAVLFLAGYLARTIILGNTSFGGPDDLKPYYLGFLWFHVLLAVSGLVLGAVTITLALKEQFVLHKKAGRWAAIIWFCSAVTGIMVYLALYVIWEPGPVTNMVKAFSGD